MHIITYNLDLRLIEIEVHGFWMVDEFDGFAQDLRNAILNFPGDGPPPHSLYNYSAAAIQPQAVVARMQQMARMTSPDRRVALYTEGCLARQQAKRVAAEGPHMRVFDSRAAALAWLAAPAAANAPQRAVG